MQSKIIWSFEAKEEDVRGSIVVVVDVWAATSNIALMLAHGAKELILVDEQTIRSTIQRIPKALVVGESLDSSITELFSCSNSPCDIDKLDVDGKSIIYMTNNGTRVISHALAQGATSVLTASYLNILAVAKTLQQRKKEPCVIIASGERTIADTIPDKKAWEDYYCSEALQEVIRGGNVNWKTRMNQSKEFITQHYDYSMESLQLVHQIDNATVLPQFIRGADGFIRNHSISQFTR